METLHKAVFWATLAWQAALLAVVLYLGLWLFAALDAVIKAIIYLT